MEKESGKPITTLGLSSPTLKEPAADSEETMCTGQALSPNSIELDEKECSIFLNVIIHNFYH